MSPCNDALKGRQGHQPSLCPRRPVGAARNATFRQVARLQNCDFNKMGGCPGSLAFGDPGSYEPSLGMYPSIASIPFDPSSR
jgi:hypothetical protein